MAIATSGSSTRIAAPKKNDIMLLIGRIMLGTLFIVPGFGKVTNYAAFGSYMTSYGVPPLLLPPAIILELCGGALLAFGIGTRAIAISFIAYLLVLAFIFHAFWAVDPKQFQAQLNLFLLHFGVIGGLLYMAAFGAGSLALDQLYGNRDPTPESNERPVLPPP